MITIWMAVSLGGGTAFFMCCSKCFHVKSVLPLQYCSTSLKVLEYFLCSTVVLSWKYSFYESMMH